MPATEPAGTQTVRHGIAALGRPLTQEQICYALMRDVRAEINGLWANDNGPVTYRMGKRDREARLAKIHAMRAALATAMGIPLGQHEDIDALLEQFKRERLDATRPTA